MPESQQKFKPVTWHDNVENWSRHHRVSRPVIFHSRFFHYTHYKISPRNFFNSVIVVAAQRFILLFDFTTEAAITCSAYLLVSVTIVSITLSVKNNAKNQIGNDSLLRVTELLMPLGPEKFISNGGV